MPTKKEKGIRISAPWTEEKYKEWREGKVEKRWAGARPKQLKRKLPKRRMLKPHKW